MSRFVNLLFIIILAFGVPVYGADYWVDADNGLNANTGTEQDPFQTISYALTRMSPTVEAPDTLHVLPGTYDLALGEAFPLTLLSHMTLQGYTPPGEQTGEVTTIDATGSNNNALTCSDKMSITLNNLTIIGGGDDATNGGGLR